MIYLPVSFAQRGDLVQRGLSNTSVHHLVFSSTNTYSPTKQASQITSKPQPPLS